VLGEVTWTKDGCSKNLTHTRNVPPKCNKQVTSKSQASHKQGTNKILSHFYQLI
jgi:hypothetical protein